MGNPNKLKRYIYTARILTIIIGGLAIIITWQYVNTQEIAIQVTIGIILILILILSNYIDKIECLICSKCGSYDASDRITRTECSPELTPRNLGNKILIINKYKCRVCGHFWYIDEHMSNGD